MVGSREPEVVIAGQGYDSDPRVADRAAPRAYNPVRYQERNKAERGFRLFQPYRRVATRYERRSRNFLGMILVAAIMLLR